MDRLRLTFYLILHNIFLALVISLSYLCLIHVLGKPFFVLGDYFIFQLIGLVMSLGIYVGMWIYLVQDLKLTAWSGPLLKYNRKTKKLIGFYEEFCYDIPYWHETWSISNGRFHFFDGEFDFNGQQIRLSCVIRKYFFKKEEIESYLVIKNDRYINYVQNVLDIGSEELRIFIENQKIDLEEFEINKSDLSENLTDQIKKRFEKEKVGFHIAELEIFSIKKL